MGGRHCVAALVLAGLSAGAAAIRLASEARSTVSRTAVTLSERMLVPSGYNLDPDHVSESHSECDVRRVRSSIATERAKLVVVEWSLLKAMNGHWGVVLELDEVPEDPWYDFHHWDLEAQEPHKPLYAAVHRMLDTDQAKQYIPPCNHAEISLYDSFSKAAAQATMGESFRVSSGSGAPSQKVLFEDVWRVAATVMAELAEPFDFFSNNCRDFVRRLLVDLGLQNLRSMIAGDSLLKWMNSAKRVVRKRDPPNPGDDRQESKTNDLIEPLRGDPISKSKSMNLWHGLPQDDSEYLQGKDMQDSHSNGYEELVRGESPGNVKTLNTWMGLPEDDWFFFPQGDEFPQEGYLPQGD